MYGFIFRHLIVRLQPESAHKVAVVGFRWGAPFLRLARLVRLLPSPRPRGAVTAMGVTFPAIVGLAAGMDKNAQSVKGFVAAGFGFVEVGTITAQPQPGNEPPRSWRELDVRGLRNRMGFNNEGADAVARRLRRLRGSRAGRAAVVGVNIGKTKATELADAPADYAYSARLLAPYADFLVVNVSSPNTPGLRDLQSTAALRPILEHVRAAANSATQHESRIVPLLVKIAPDLADADVDAIADVAVELGLDGIVATNTTINHDRGPGGLSGPPVRERALEVVRRLRGRVGEDLTIMGVGGISSVTEAEEFLDAGADLLQVYTAFVYQGPWWLARLNAYLSRRI